MKEKAVKDFTKGNIIPQLWKLAWPMMMTIFFYTFYNLVDTFWVSKISTDSIAAVWVSQMALMVIMSIGMWISIGSSVLTSMNIWAWNKPEASRVMAQSFILATISGLIFTLIFYIFREHILTISWAVGSIYEPALSYFSIVTLWSILLFYLLNIMMVFNAEGDTFMATKLFAISTAVNVILDPILIFWKFGFPEMGIQGAAYATIISQSVFIIIAMRILSSKKRSVRFEWKNLSLKLESVKKVFNIGIPAACTQMINPIGLAILTYMVSTQFLEAWVTAFSLVFRLEFFAYLPAVWFSMAAMSMIWQNIWAGNISRAHEVFKKASLMWFISAIVLGLGLILWGKYILWAFTTDPLVLKYAFSYLWIVAGTYWFLAISMVVASTFQATGKPWNGFLLMFIRFFVIAIPITYIGIYVYDAPIWIVWSWLATANIMLAVIWYTWNQRIFSKVAK